MDGDSVEEPVRVTVGVPDAVPVPVEVGDGVGVAAAEVEGDPEEVPELDGVTPGGRLLVGDTGLTEAVADAMGVPVRATLVQFALVNFLLLVTSFEQVLTGAQVLLQLCSFLAVLGVMILRRSAPNLPRPYRTWGYPVTPLIFLGVSGWMLWHTIVSKPLESATSLAVAAAGLLLYFFSHRKDAPTNNCSKKI